MAVTSARVRRSERSVRKPAARAWQQRTGGHARHVNDQIGRAARIATRELASDAFSIDDRARLTLKVSVCVQRRSASNSARDYFIFGVKY